MVMSESTRKVAREVKNQSKRQQIGEWPPFEMQAVRSAIDQWRTVWNASVYISGGRKRGGSLKPNEDR